MARRSRRSDRRVFEQGGPYHRPSGVVPLPLRDDAYEDAAQNTLLQRMLHPESAVYPWQSSRTLRVYTGSPYRHERSEFNRRVLTASLRELQYGVPGRVLVCVRRKRRKQVLFAYGRVGRGGMLRKKRWRRTQDSLWRC